VADKEEKRPSSDDLIRRARERYGSDPRGPSEEDPSAPGEDSRSEADDLDLEEYTELIRSEQPDAVVETPEEVETIPEEIKEETQPIETEPEPMARTIPIQFEPEPNTELEPERPRERPDTPKTPGRRLPRNIGWLLVLAFILLNRCGVIEDIFGDPAGEQLMTAIEGDIKDAGLSDESWDCIETSLRDDGRVDDLNELRVSDVEDALETFPVGSPPALRSFMEGFESYFSPLAPTSCVTPEEFESLDFTVLDSA
jgi:hypothetical protein